MAMQDRIVNKVMGSVIPQLIEKLESMHGFMELQAMIQQEIWIELMRKRNHMMTEQEARDITDGNIEIFQERIEKGTEFSKNPDSNSITNTNSNANAHNGY